MAHDDDERMLRAIGVGGREVGVEPRELLVGLRNVGARVLHRYLGVVEEHDVGDADVVGPEALRPHPGAGEGEGRVEVVGGRVEDVLVVAGGGEEHELAEREELPGVVRVLPDRVEPARVLRLLRTGEDEVAREEEGLHVERLDVLVGERPDRRAVAGVAVDAEGDGAGRRESRERLRRTPDLGPRGAAADLIVIGRVGGQPADVRLVHVGCAGLGGGREGPHVARLYRGERARADAVLHLRRRVRRPGLPRERSGRGRVGIARQAGRRPAPKAETDAHRSRGRRGARGGVVVGGGRGVCEERRGGDGVPATHRRVGEGARGRVVLRAPGVRAR